MGRVEVVEYRPAWPARFAELRDAYADALRIADVPVVAIEHVGSTAVPGLAAKPVIDVDVVVGATEVDAAAAALGRIGFRRSAATGVPGRVAFVTPERFRPSNTYVVVDGSLALRNHLAVRDVLRADPSLRDEYAAVKRHAAADAADIDAYLAMKEAVLTRVLQRAGLSAADLAGIAAANRAIAARGALG
ncbi:GrpB family protein [Microbacterium sp. M1A1_1b]